tara:strand:- start:37 stop:246 length:210 start_codon:yes stop_codon:yes gene_type:complete
MIMSTPNQTTVKYNAAIYPTEESCIMVKESYMEAFNAKSEEYKKGITTEVFCIPFNSFPIIGMPGSMGA